jgi:hypothetical protein
MKGLMYKSLNIYVLIKISTVTNHMLGRAKRKLASTTAADAMRYERAENLYVSGWK